MINGFTPTFEYDSDLAGGAAWSYRDEFSGVLKHGVLTGRTEPHVNMRSIQIGFIFADDDRYDIDFLCFVENSYVHKNVSFLLYYSILKILIFIPHPVLGGRLLPEFWI